MKFFVLFAALFSFFVGGNAIELAVFPFYCPENDSIQNHRISLMIQQNLEQNFAITLLPEPLPDDFYEHLFSSFHQNNRSFPFPETGALISNQTYFLAPAALKVDNFYFFHFVLADIPHKTIAQAWKNEGNATQFVPIFRQLSEDLLAFFQNENKLPPRQSALKLSVTSTQPHITPLAKIIMPDYDFSSYTDAQGECILPPFSDYFPHAVIAISVSGSECAATFLRSNQQTASLTLPVFSDNIQMLDGNLHHLGDNANDHQSFLTEAEGSNFVTLLNTRFFARQEDAHVELFSCFSGLDEGAEILVNGKRLCIVQTDGDFHFSFPATLLEEMAENIIEIRSIEGDDFQFATLRCRINQ